MWMEAMFGEIVPSSVVLEIIEWCDNRSIAYVLEEM
jgi:hypothetical protein